MAHKVRDLVSVSAGTPGIDLFWSPFYGVMVMNIDWQAGGKGGCPCVDTCPGSPRMECSGIALRPLFLWYRRPYYNTILTLRTMGVRSACSHLHFATTQRIRSRRWPWRGWRSSTAAWATVTSERYVHADSTVTKFVSCIQVLG